jgi:adenylate cyclase
VSDDASVLLEETLLGGPRTYTRIELAERSGVPLDYSRRLWRAMGFADVPDHERVFTEGDLFALHALRDLEAAGLIDEATALTSTRAMGQQLSRLAEWQVSILTERLLGVEGTNHEQVEQLVADVAEQVLPDIERMLILVWRRQLAVHAPRAVAAALGEQAGSNCLVGFADLVNYTRMSRAIAPDELAALLEEFEDRATLILAEHGGRLVKTLGDEVLFVADEVRAGAEIALALVESHAQDESMPDLRAGLAAGSVLSRLGDVYGEPVNLASRLTSLARPGSVLVDREVAGVLEDDPAYELRSLPRQRVRGYRQLEASVLRRADTPA